ncbi:hypothetical protein AVEN_1331-1 [Araneus ventricosus]|uniref:Uncharacterized protein n=1 Tax=Araneus ventricosus TaxID=182803 RepID=A0A4Y2D4E6_ARAVE|nr:hypothetical protein AVEN_1331-1 [Araneus ventricosus]
MTRQGGERGKRGDISIASIPRKSPNRGVGNSVSIELGAGSTSARNGLRCRAGEVQFVSGRKVPEWVLLVSLGTSEERGRFKLSLHVYYLALGTDGNVAFFLGPLGYRRTETPNILFNLFAHNDVSDYCNE